LEHANDALGGTPGMSREWGLLVGVGVVTAALAVVALYAWRARRAPESAIVRCPIHGIAYDAQLEVCPECAKPADAPTQVRSTHAQ
jgi:hypothetical protein